MGIQYCIFAIGVRRPNLVLGFRLLQMQLLGGFCCYLIPRLTFLRPNTHASYLWGGGFNPAQSFAQPALAFLVKIRCLNDLIFIRGRTKVKVNVCWYFRVPFTIAVTMIPQQMFESKSNLNYFPLEYCKGKKRGRARVPRWSSCPGYQRINVTVIDSTVLTPKLGASIIAPTRIRS